MKRNIIEFFNVGMFITLICGLMLVLVVSSTAYQISTDANTKYINVSHKMFKCDYIFLIEDDAGYLYELRSEEYNAIPNINTYNELREDERYLVQIANKYYITNVIDHVEK